jgi:serine/threonine-protein kinase RsbW
MLPSLRRGTERLIRLKLPSSIEYRELAMRFVTSACKLVQPRRRARATGALRPDEDFDDQVISAFGEAFNNAALHNHGPGDGELEIEVEPLPDRLVIRLKDNGHSFDFERVPEPDLDSLPESGLGIFIMRSCMDAVEYCPGQPNVLSMTKFLVHDEG